MPKQTNKALPSDKLSSLALSGSAAAAILLPQAINKSSTAALHQVCAIYSAGPALLHGRLRQLRCKLRRQRCCHCFFITLS